MATPPLTREQAQETIAAIRQALAEGCAPLGAPYRRGVRSCLIRAAEILATAESTIRKRVEPAGAITRLYPDLAIDWASLPAPSAPKVEPRPAQPSPPPRAAPDRETTGLRDEIASLRAALKEAHRESLNEQAVRAILGSMASVPSNPPDWVSRIPARTTAGTPEVPITIWSDWHLGEVVSKEETGNEFNMAVAERRIRRLVDSTINIASNHGPGNYPGLVLCLLGDFVSGGLHPELAKTDELEIIPSTLKARDLLVAAIDRMASAFGRLYVPCTAGNHGRGTPKPEHKRYIFKNFDWLIYEMLRRHFEGDQRIQFDVRPANEIHFQVYGQRYLAMHGDMLGVKGGDGIIGAIGPIMRGEVKTRGQSSSLGRDYDVLLMGHWHQTLWLPRAIVANTLKGFDEYARTGLRAPPSDPSQPLWFVHPQRGITSRWEVKVEDATQKNKEWVSWAG